MKIDNKFGFQQTVYLLTDIEQRPRLVTALVVRLGLITYQLSCGTVCTSHYDYEISEQPDQMVKFRN